MINNFILLPIGVGAEHGKEWRLFDKTTDSGKLESTEWYGATDWTSQLVLEAGLQMVIKHITFYGMYRLIGFQENSFAVGGGCLF